MAAVQPITGTVSVGFDGGTGISVGRFSVPVEVTIDGNRHDATVIAHLEAAPRAAVVAAMITALREAADKMLASLPVVKAETIAVCPTCDAELGVADASITIEHAEHGAHIENHRY